MKFIFQCPEMKSYWCRAPPVVCGFSSTTAELSNSKLRSWICDQQNLKYLPSGHLLKTFANAWFGKIPRYPVTFEVCKEGHFLTDIFCISLFTYVYLYVFLAELGLCFCTQAFFSCSKWGLLFLVVHGLLTLAASLVAD